MTLLLRHDTTSTTSTIPTCLTFPSLLNRLKPDLFLSPDGFLSLRYKGKSMNVIHDLNFEHYPEDLPILTRKYYRHYFPKYAQKAVRIATVSDYSRQDIIEQYHVNADKIDIVYDGANEIYKPLTEEEKVMTRQFYSDGKPFFLFIGSLHPRKNLSNLFRAFDLFKKTNPSDAQLLIVGARKWWTPEIDSAYQRMIYSRDVIFTGRLNIEHLRYVLGAACALTYVSYFEGFGIPIVEAFRCGTPVITSDATSMPEVAGDGALLVDPFDPESIAMAMYKIYQYKTMRDELVLRGHAREDLFTWQHTADRLWESIEKALKTN